MQRVKWILSGLVVIAALAVTITSVPATEKYVCDEDGTFYLKSVSADDNAPHAGVDIEIVRAPSVTFSGKLGEQVIELDDDPAKARDQIIELFERMAKDSEFQEEMTEKLQDCMEQAVDEVRRVFHEVGCEDDDKDEIREVAEAAESLEILRELTFDPELMGLAAIAKLQETPGREEAEIAALLEKALVQTRNHGLRNMIRCSLGDLYCDMDKTDEYVENALELLAENDEMLEDDEEDTNSDDSDGEEDTEDH